MGKSGMYKNNGLKTGCDEMRYHDAARDWEGKAL